MLLPDNPPILARKPIIITNYARLVFNTNELPTDTEQTHAYFRRFLIIPFEVIIKDENQDKKLAQNIIEQRPYSSVEELLSRKILKNNVYERNKNVLSVY